MPFLVNSLYNLSEQCVVTCVSTDNPWPMLSGHLHKTNNNEDKLSRHLARHCLCPIVVFFECNSFNFFSFFYPFVKNYFSYLHFNCHMHWLTLQINELSPQSKIRVQCRSVKLLHTTHAHPCPCGPCFVHWFGGVRQYFGQSVYKGRCVGLDIIFITIQFICMVPTKWMPRHFTL